MRTISSRNLLIIMYKKDGREAHVYKKNLKKHYYIYSILMLVS